MTQDLTWGRRYLMCPPTHFDVSYAINPWMDVAVKVDRMRAQRQWDALVQALADAGAQIETLAPHPKLPDLVFTANLGLVDGDTFIPARMRHPQRQAEPAHAEAWFRAHGYAIRRMTEDVVQEGAGDGLPFDGTLVGGYRTRSSASAYVDLARLTDARILPVELVDERFYHVDIVFCPLDARSALIAPQKMDADSARLIQELVPDPILLTDEEAGAFSANAVVVGRTVVMAACSPRLQTELRERGFEPVVVDVSEFLKAGGGPRCLTLALDVELSRQDTAALADRYTAHNYHPLPVTVTHAEGSWVHDDRGRRYLDALSAYSALNFGHRHPALVAAAQHQLERVTLTSRAFSNDQLGPFARDLAALTRKDRVVPMNTGAEAVETAIKAARKWGYEVKGVAPGRATIVVCDGNFHGRTTTIVSFSDDPLARDGFGPFTPGFVSVPFGDAAALEAVLRTRGEDVVAFLVEPVQGEAGVDRPARRLPARRAAPVQRARRAPRRRRDPVRPRPHRAHVRLRPRGRRAGPLRPRQGARRRDRRAVGGGRRRRRARRPAPGHARLDVRRQPARLRGRPRGPRPARHRRAAGQRRPRSARSCAPRSTRPRRRRSARSARAGCGSAWTCIPATAARAPPASGCWPPVCWRRTPTSRRCGSPRR